MGATAHKTDPSVKMATAVVNDLRGPHRSLTQPEAGMNAATVTR